MKLSIILMIITILSKIFGLLREVSLSYVYGTGVIADAFLVSFFIPSILINGITLGIATGFIPIYSKISTEEGRISADKFANNLTNVVFILSLVATMLAVIFSREILGVVAFGFKNESMEIAVFFSRLIMTSIVIASVGGVFRGYLQYYNKFVITVANAIIMNLVIIIFIYISKRFGYRFLGIGTALGMSLQYLILIFPLRKLGYSHDRKIDFRDKRLKLLLKISLPVLLGVLVNEANLIVDKAIGSQLGVGAVSVLNYSSGIQDFVIGVVILSIITVQYPEMSKLSVSNKNEELVEKYNYTIRMNLFLVIPATIGLMVFSKEITKLLFFRGAFDLKSLELTSQALFYYAFGLIGVSVNTVGQRIMYAKNQIKEPVLISIFSVLLNIVLNLQFSKIMGVTGLALATSIAMSITGIITSVVLWIKGIKINKDTFEFGILKTSIIALIVILMSKGVYGLGENNFYLIISIILAIIVYLYLGTKFSIINGEELKKIFRRLFKREN